MGVLWASLIPEWVVRSYFLPSFALFGFFVYLIPTSLHRIHLVSTLYLFIPAITFFLWPLTLSRAHIPDGSLVGCLGLDRDPPSRSHRSLGKSTTSKHCMPPHTTRQRPETLIPAPCASLTNCSGLYYIVLVFTT